jgi:hypothetical protein
VQVYLVASLCVLPEWALLYLADVLVGAPTSIGHGIL